MEMVSSFYYNYIRGDIIMLEDLKQALQEALPELRNNIFIDAHKLCVYIGIAQNDYDMRAVSIFWITSDFYNIFIGQLPPTTVTPLLTRAALIRSAALTSNVVEFVVEYKDEYIKPLLDYIKVESERYPEYVDQLKMLGFQKTGEQSYNLNVDDYVQLMISRPCQGKLDWSACVIMNNATVRCLHSGLLDNLLNAIAAGGVCDEYYGSDR